jgi:hypothetical protein
MYHLAIFLTSSWLILTEKNINIFSYVSTTMREIRTGRNSEIRQYTILHTVGENGVSWDARMA